MSFYFSENTLTIRQSGTLLIINQTKVLWHCHLCSYLNNKPEQHLLCKMKNHLDKYLEKCMHKWSLFFPICYSAEEVNATTIWKSQPCVPHILQDLQEKNRAAERELKGWVTFTACFVESWKVGRENEFFVTCSMHTSRCHTPTSSLGKIGQMSGSSLVWMHSNSMI